MFHDEFNLEAQQTNRGGMSKRGFFSGFGSPMSTLNLGSLGGGIQQAQQTQAPRQQSSRMPLAGIGGIIGGIGSVVDMAIANEQAAQPYQAMTSSALTPTQSGFEEGMFGQILPQIGQPGPVYGGQRVAGVSPLQSQGFRLAGATPQATQQAMAGMGNILENVSQNPSNLFQPVVDAALNTFETRTAPSIAQSYAGLGAASGGEMQRALSRAGADLSTQLAGQLAGMQQAGLQMQVSALPQFANFSQLPTLAGAGLAGLGSQQRGIEQQQLGADMAIFQESQPYANPWLQYGMRMLPTSGSFQDTALIQQPVSQEEAVYGAQKAAIDPFGIFSGKLF